MRFNTLFLLFVSCLSLALAQVTYDDCCLKYVKRMSNGAQKHAVDYRNQVTDGGCNIPAVIFVMRKGRVFCADPRERWVEELREKIDKKKSLKGVKSSPKKHHPRRPYRG
ncbi:C-C motif chemokine 4 [Morone saxatilis]|uniref:C-C motif chemokine 4 n=1 Tax=Morone saxatilis TaxID=34816 RepID=UPI0015E219C0|nr:C-C motif chemokine 4 [Morone saxatilis]